MKVSSIILFSLLKDSPSGYSIPENVSSLMGSALLTETAETKPIEAKREQRTLVDRAKKGEYFIFGKRKNKTGRKN